MMTGIARLQSIICYFLKSSLTETFSASGIVLAKTVIALYAASR